MPSVLGRRKRRPVKSEVTVSDRLRALRMGSEMSLRELAQRLGWNVMRVSRIEHGTNRVLVEDVEQICAVFGISVTDFHGG